MNIHFVQNAVIILLALTAMTLGISEMLYILRSLKRGVRNVSILIVATLITGIGIFIQDLVLSLIWWILAVSIIRWIRQETITVVYRETTEEIPWIEPIYGYMVVVIPVPVAQQTRPNQCYLLFTSTWQGTKVRDKIYAETVNKSPVEGFFAIKVNGRCQNKAPLMENILRDTPIFIRVKTERKR